MDEPEQVEEMAGRREQAENDPSRVLAGARAYIQTLPAVERRIATLAAGGAATW